jgi:hypothetical protein
MVTEISEISTRSTSFLYPEDGGDRRWRQQVLPKRFLAPTIQYGFIIRYILMYIFTAVKTSNFTQNYY